MVEPMFWNAALLASKRLGLCSGPGAVRELQMSLAVDLIPPTTFEKSDGLAA
jgi:hypothetical protein